MEVAKKDDGQSTHPTETETPPRVETAEWYQLFVLAPEGSMYVTPEAMKEIDNHLQQYVALMPKPKDLPEQEDDGTWQIRVMVPAMLAEVKNILTKQYGLKILREIAHGATEPEQHAETKIKTREEALKLLSEALAALQITEHELAWDSRAEQLIVDGKQVDKTKWDGYVQLQADSIASMISVRRPEMSRADVASALLTVEMGLATKAAMERSAVGKWVETVHDLRADVAMTARYTHFR